MNSSAVFFTHWLKMNVHNVFGNSLNETHLFLLDFGGVEQKSNPQLLTEDSFLSSFKSNYVWSKQKCHYT